MKTTLRQIDKALEDIAKAMPRTVAEYYWGDWSDAFNDNSRRKFPLTVANVEPVVTFGKVTGLKINIIVVDQVNKTEMLKEVESDTLQTSHDFYRVMKYSPNWNDFCVVRQAGANLKFKDKGPDEVAGWRTTYDVVLKENVQLCDLPLEDYDFNKKIKC